MKPMSFSETVFLFILALVIFGPKKLPEIARQAGKFLNEFRRASNEFKAQIEQEIANIDVENKKQALPPGPTPEGTASRSLASGNPGSASPGAGSNGAGSNEVSSPQPAESTSPEASPAPATLSTSAEEPSTTSSDVPPATEAVPSEQPPSGLARSESTSELGEPASVTSSTTQESHA